MQPIDRPDIIVGHLMQVIMLNRPVGKRTGQKRLVRVQQILRHIQPKRAVRAVLIETVDHLALRHEWVNPKYLVALTPEAS